MAFIPLPNGVRIKWSGVIDGLPWSSRIFAVGSLSPTPTICAGLAAAVVAWSTTSWAPTANPAATIDHVVCQDWSVHLGVKAEAPSTAVGTLAGATGALPSVVAARVELLPASGGFRHPGALFHAGIDLSQTAGTDTLTGGAVTAIHTAYQALINDINSALVPAFISVMASFRLAGIPRVAGVPFSIASVAVRPKVGTQVRRIRSVR